MPRNVFTGFRNHSKAGFFCLFDLSDINVIIHFLVLKIHCGALLSLLSFSNISRKEKGIGKRSGREREVWSLP